MSRFIVLYNYNKYYNRIIKKLNTYEEYKALITPLGSTPAQYHGFEVNSVNFNYEDGVFAKHVINIPKGYSSFYNFHEPDYFVLERTYKDGDVNVTEVSRWFVLETQKTRGNQLELSLKRDLLADYFNKVCSAPVFIEKGNPAISDPAIFNRESMTYNQIKKNELLLNFDKRSGRGNGWIVGYLKQSTTPYDITGIKGKAELPNVVSDYAELPQELRNILDSGNIGRVYHNIFDVISIVNGTTTAEYPYAPIRKGLKIKTTSSQHCSFVGPIGSEGESYGLLRFNTFYERQIVDHFNARSYSFYTDFVNVFANWYNSLNIPNKVPSSLLSYNGLIYSRNGKYYQIVVNRKDSETYTKTYTLSQLKPGSYADDIASVIRAYWWNYIREGTECQFSNVANNAYEAAIINAYDDGYEFKSQEIEYNEVSATISKERNQNLNAPYDLFCIPLKNVVVKSGGTPQFSIIENVAVAIARGVSVAGSSNVLDIQILPYCPIEEILDSNGDIDILSFTEHKDYDFIRKTVGGQSENVGIIIYPKTCRGTFDITITNQQQSYSECLAETESVIEKKVKSETKLARFVSPNFASTFDINVQKNGGITRLNVDYFYKPYSPYIHIAPYFSGLYGEDFNDPKGLICSGDFSIATAQSEWENYQIQNKNYELIFNRQIQNLDVNNSIAYDVQKITAGIGQGTSLLTGLAGGAVAGSMIGGPIGTAVGALAGAVGGAALSGVGAKYDLEYLKKSQAEARSYAVDMYGYNLGNIKALPYTLTRVSAFTENNKIFPFIEFYDATDEEKEAIRNKIKYNGMTVMRIGQIFNFIGSTNKYVQGQLIRLEGIDEDSHVVAEIANEIKLGGYYYGSNPIES